MTLEPATKLFVGFAPEGRLRLAYASAKPERYVSDGVAGQYLTSLEVDGKLYLGKVVAGGLSTDRVDDVSRNVLSILRQMVGNETLPKTLSIFALSDTAKLIA